MFGATSVAEGRALGGRAHAAVERRARRALDDIDAAVEPEDVLGVVGVVADRVGPGDDELAGEAALALEAVGIGPVPQRAAVALVDRDGVRKRERALVRRAAADVVRRHRVEEDRVGRDVDAGGSGSRYWPVLYSPTSNAPRQAHCGSGMPVGHVDLVERHAVDDRARRPGGREADALEHGPLPHRVADPELPAQPADLAPVDGEARALRAGSRRAA